MSLSSAAMDIACARAWNWSGNLARQHTTLVRRVKARDSVRSMHQAVQVEVNPGFMVNAGMLNSRYARKGPAAESKGKGKRPEKRAPGTNHASSSTSLMRPRNTSKTQAAVKTSSLGALRSVKADNVSLSPANMDLEQRIEALKDSLSAEEDASDEVYYSEEEIMNIYVDLLAVAPAEAAPSAQQALIAQSSADRTTLDNLAARLTAQEVDQSQEEEVSSFAHTLRQRRGTEDESVQASVSTAVASIEATSFARRLLHRLAHVLAKSEELKKSAGVASSSKNPADALPSGLVSAQEWLSLIRICVEDTDGQAAETTLSLMKEYRFAVPVEGYDAVLGLYAQSGMAAAADAFVTKFLRKPAESHRHLHIKAHLFSAPNVIPDSALALLHDYESRTLFAPQKTYNTVVHHLFHLRTPMAHAHAWDLFSHMRYVAHPSPDAHFYATMIRACAYPLAFRANSKRSEVERALDLWTEMTTEANIPPTRYAYNAIILACARSGSPKYISEAFRYAQQMLDAHRDARGTPEFRPDTYTFHALLAGAKRMRDLPRVRWILAEMVKESGHRTTFGDQGDVVIDEKAMLHVFHAYAAYKPPFRRSDAVLVDEPEAELATDRESSRRDETPGSPPSNGGEEGEISGVQSFSHVPPSTHEATAREADYLFSRIMDDLSPEHGSGSRPFGQVEPTPELLHAYVEVHYAHSPLEDAMKLYWTLRAEHLVDMPAALVVSSLERCALGREAGGRQTAYEKSGAPALKKDRQLALEFAEKLWQEWSLTEEEWLADERKMQPREVEKAYVAMIKTLTFNNELDRAVALVRTFHSRYSPSAVAQPSAQPPMRSTRTRLVGDKPLVRMTSATEVSDPSVPPLLVFSDVELLDQQLVHARRTRDLKYLKYACECYVGALRRRKRETMASVSKTRGTGAEKEKEKAEKPPRSEDASSSNALST